MSNSRENIINVFEKKSSDKLVASMRLDLWYNHAKNNGTLPSEVKDMSVEEIEMFLGFAQTARFRSFFNVHFLDTSQSETLKGDEIHFNTVLPNHTLTTVSKLTQDMANAGMLSHVVKYPVVTNNDYKALTEAYLSAEIKINESEFRAFDIATGEHGLPMCILGVCPAHLVALNYTGYEQFYFDQIDRPELLNALIDAIDNLFRKNLWPAIMDSNAKLILHGAHFSASMTPKPIFDRYFVPYFSEFNALMHKYGKFVGFHGDANLSGLTPLIPKVGFDYVDCLATKPLVEESLCDYTSVWKGTVICWGGLPSVIFDQSYDESEYEEIVRNVIDFSKGRDDIILGASDNILPGTPWERLTWLAEQIQV